MKISEYNANGASFITIKTAGRETTLLRYPFESVLECLNRHRTEEQARAMRHEDSAAFYLDAIKTKVAENPPITYEDNLALARELNPV